MLNVWIKSEKGAVLPLVGVAIFTLLMAAGLTIDYARALIVKERLQWALDAAALAGTKKAPAGDDAVQAEAQDYFEANFPTGYMSTSKAYVNVVPKESAQGVGYRFTVTNMSMDTYIMTTVGLDTIGVGAVAEVNTLPVTPLDVVFSLDLSGSMQVLAGIPGSDCVFLNAAGIYPGKCYSSNPDAQSKLADAKREINKLVDALGSGTEDTRFGLVPWSSFVNVNGVLNGVSGARTCFDGKRAIYLASEDKSKTWTGNAATPNMEDANACREFADGTIRNEGSLRPMVYLTTDTVSFKEEVLEQKAEANTDGALGMYWAYTMLKGNNSAGWRASFGDPWRAPAINKSIVLLTDGNNTKYYASPSKADALTKGTPANTRQLELCAAAKAENITIYTIAYDIKGADTQRINAKNMLMACASEACPSPAGTMQKCFFDAQSPGDLAAAMRVIGQTMMTMRLTK